MCLGALWSKLAKATKRRNRRHAAGAAARPANQDLGADAGTTESRIYYDQVTFVCVFVSLYVVLSVCK